MKPYFLYFLYSDSVDRFYIGSSDNPSNRLIHHNTDNKGWTRRGRPWRIVYTKNFPSKEEAQKWERWIKRQKSRHLIEQIIQGNFSWNTI